MNTQSKPVTCPEHGVQSIRGMGSERVTLTCGAVGNSEEGFRHYPDAGKTVRTHLGAALAKMVDRYAAEHFDGRSIHPDHLAQLESDPAAQVEDFLMFMVRQPELVTVYDGVAYTVERPDTVAYSVKTGREVERGF